MQDRTPTIIPSARRVKRTLLIVAAVAVAAAGTTPWLLHADSTAKPATQPANLAPPPTKLAPPAAKLAPPAVDSAIDESAMTQEDWRAFRAFMSEHSPLKWATFDDMNRRRPGGNTTSQLRRELINRFNQLRRIEISDPARFQLEVSAIRIQDEIYGILGEVRKGMNPEANEGKLRDACAALIDVRQRWRVERLRRVRDELQELKLNTAASEVEKELDREEGGVPGPGKKTRQELAEEMASRFRQNWGKAPALNRALPGGERPGERTAPSSRPATGPAVTP